MAKRIQYRAECCVCGKIHAVRGDVMVAHGYTVYWGSFNGNCSGADNVHLGHKDAPAFIEKVIKYLESELAKLPERLVVANAIQAVTRGEAYQKKVTIQNLQAQTRAIPATVEILESKIANWVEKAPYEVDLEVEEAGERKARQDAADAKRAEKEAKQAEKEARKQLADERALAKYKALMADDVYRQIIIAGEIIKEVQQGFERERDLNNFFRNEIRTVVVDRIKKGLMTQDDAYFGNYDLVIMSRTGSGKSGKQLDKFSGGYRFNDITKEELV